MESLEQATQRQNEARPKFINHLEIQIMKTIFTTTAQEPKQNEILVTIASRASKDSSGKEKPAAHKPYYGIFEIPEQIETQTDEIVKLAAIAGLSAAYSKFARSKLPTKLLASAGGAEQQIVCTLEDLRAALASEAAEARRITKEAINETWKVVAANAIHKLCQLKGVQSESALPDQLRRQVGAQLQKRQDWLLSLASTTGILLRSEQEITEALAWITPLAEKEAAEGGWIFAACLDKCLKRLEVLQAKEPEQEAEEEPEVSLDELI